MFWQACNTDDILTFTLKGYSESFRFVFDEHSYVIIFEDGVCRTVKGTISLPDVTFWIHKEVALDIINGRVSSAAVDLAADAGVSMIFQEFNQVKHMMVMENIYLGREPRTKSGSVDFQKMQDDSKRLLEELGVDWDLKAKMADLTVAKFQLVEIVKAISYDADAIIMDEATSALSRAEIDYLLKTVGHMSPEKLEIYRKRLRQAARRIGRELE